MEHFQILISVSVLFALNLTYSVAVGWFQYDIEFRHGIVILRYLAICFAILRYLANFSAVLRCSEPPDVPLREKLKLKTRDFQFSM